MSRSTFTRIIVFGSFLFSSIVALAEDLKVDFRYKPARWNTAIDLPDDWQKTLVSETGAMLYEFAGTKAGFKTTVSAGVASGPMATSDQHLLNPKTPIVMTTSHAAGTTLSQQAFAIVDSPFKTQSKPRLHRLGGERYQKGWAKPEAGFDPAFQNIALGRNESIRYAYDVEANGARTVAVGLIEGYWRIAGKRVLDVRVEGARTQTIDAFASKGANRPLVALFDGRDLDGDGHIGIEVRASALSPDKNTVLSALWIFPQGDHPAAAEIFSGRLNAKAEAYMACGEDPDLRTYAPRRDLLHLDYRGANLQPVVRVQSTHAITFDAGTGVVSLNGRPFLVSRPKPLAAQIQKGQMTLVYAASSTQIDVVVVNGPDVPLSAFGPVDFTKEHDRAVAFWTSAHLPWNRVRVPDAGIQALLDSSVRNIYQARDIKRGKAEFRTGPTMYRNVWLVDGAFLLEMATELGDVEDSRRAIDRILEYQKPSGQVILLQPDFYKETGIALWILERHARLTQDKSWLKARWKNVSEGVRWIKAIRKEASKDPSAPYAGLIPPGHSDGGIGERGPNAEYTNVYWNLAGLKAAIDAAKWLGKTDQASDWQAEYDDFFSTFQKAAARDMKVDANGNRYLPILMNPSPNDLAQKAQWAFCQAIFPGKVLAPDDPIAIGTLAMLDGANSEGLVLSTGWMTGGIWTYFGSFYGHAHLWMGGPEHIAKAQAILYAFANHASPLLAWREEQKPVGRGLETVGDMPHNWASAEFIRFVRHLIAIERGDRLVLFEGVPDEWLKAGKEIRLDDIATEFGRLSVSASVSTDGQRATIELAKIGSVNQQGAPVIDLKVFKRAGFKDASGLELPDEIVASWAQPLTLKLTKSSAL